MNYYRQCRMVREVSETYRTVHTAWIPEKYSVVDSVIKIKFDVDWIDGWVVEFVGEARREEKQLPDHRKTIRSHRNTTGDSLKK